MSNHDQEVMGNPGHRARVLPHPNAEQVAVPVETFEAPAGITDGELAVWTELAPFAFKNRTLTRATALGFYLMCRNIVLEREQAVNPDLRGGANHRGIIQRIDAELLRFNLAPCGKAIYEADEPKAPANPLERFLNRKRG